MPSARRAAADTITGFTAHCAELLAPLGPVRCLRMFGGHGLYVDEVFVAIVADEVLYLKADALTAHRFEQAGCRPFLYSGKGREINLGYWTVPDEAMEAPPSMVPWARLALEAAVRARAAKQPKRAAAKVPAGTPAAKARQRKPQPAR